MGTSRTDRYRGGLRLVHSVNGFRLHQTAMYLERQAQFGDIPRPREGSAGVFLDSAQPVADGVGVGNKYLGVPRTEASLSCHARNVSNSISRSSSGRSPKPSNAAPTVLIITSGALTAAVARMEPSNTATEDVESVGPRNITLATCRARGVSRRSPKAALTPTRTVVIRDSSATIRSSLWPDSTCTISTCTSGSSRHAEKMSRLRSFDSISGSGAPPPLGTWAATTTNGPLMPQRHRRRLRHPGSPTTPTGRLMRAHLMLDSGSVAYRTVTGAEWSRS